MSRAENESDVILKTPKRMLRISLTDLEIAELIHAYNMNRLMNIPDQGFLFEQKKCENSEDNFVGFVEDVFLLPQDNIRVWWKIAKGQLPG